MPRDDAILADMYRAARLAQDFVLGMDLSAFTADRKTQSAVFSPTADPR
jgi:uncharacterized protein with HEPN domain